MAVIAIRGGLAPATDTAGNLTGIVGPDGVTRTYLDAGYFAGASKIFGIGSGGTAITAGLTIVTQHPAEYDFAGLQLLYQNQSASAYTVTKARAASTPTHQNLGDTATWYDALFAGASSGVCAASPGGAGSDTRSSYLLSDFVPCLSVARTDDTSKTPLAQIRSYFAAAANGLSVGAGDIAAWNAGTVAAGRQFAARAPAGDQTATFTSSQQPLEAGTWVMPQTVIFHYASGVKTLLTCGDSLTKGHLTTGGATSWPAILTGSLRTAGKQYANNNAAWTGQTQVASIAVGKDLIQSFKPDYCSFFGWSPNDALAASVNQATFDAGYVRAIEMVAYCRRNGVRPVVCTSGAWNALSGAQNTMRRNNNTRLLALRTAGVIVFDFATAIDDPANNAQINPLYNQGDGLHYNDAGHAALAAEAVKYF